jgi:tetratricopeptide (TPR) repeat protein/acyl carrier protein
VAELGVTAVDFEAEVGSLGLDSLSELQLLADIEEAMSVIVEPADMRECGSIGEFAALLARLAAKHAGSAPKIEHDPAFRVVKLREGKVEPPLVLLHGLAGTCPTFHPPQPIERARAVLGIHWRPTEFPPAAVRLESHAAKCVAALREAQPTGPYCLAGHSFAAHLALEVAQQLFAAGEHVAFLGVIDDEADFHKRYFGVRNAGDIEATVKTHCQHMMAGYVTRTYRGDVWLIQATVRPASHLADPQQGWGDIVSGKIHRIDARGDHGSILAKESVDSWLPQFDGQLALAVESARDELSHPEMRERRQSAARERDERSSWRHVLQARDACKSGDREGEIAAYQAAIRSGPADRLPWWLYRNLGEAQAEAHRPEEAAEAFLCSVERESIPLVGIARAVRHLRSIKRHEQAAHLLARARDVVAPDEPHAHFALSEIAALDGDDAAAEAHLRRTWEIVPNAMLWWRLTDFLGRRGRVTEALPLAAEVSRRWPNDEIRQHIARMKRLIEPDLHLLVDGVRVDAESCTAARWTFRLAAPASSIQIASRSCVPRRLHSKSPDDRMLGVALAKIVLHGPAGRIEIGHDDPTLTRGFHPPEAHHRWTDGLGMLPAKAIAQLAGGSRIEVHLGATALQYERYPA